MPVELSYVSKNLLTIVGKMLGKFLQHCLFTIIHLHVIEAVCSVKTTNFTENDAFHSRYRRSVPQVLSIGIILDHSDYYDYEVGINYTRRKINYMHDEWYIGTQFDIRVKKIDTQRPKELMEAICSHMSHGVYLLITTPCLATRRILVEFSNKFQMPVIVLSRASQRLAGEYLLQMQPLLAEPFLTYAIHMEWNMSIWYVYDHLGGAQAIEEVFETEQYKNIDIFINPVYIEKLSDSRKFLRTMDKTFVKHEQGILVLNMKSEASMQELFKYILQIGMTRDGYHFFVDNLDLPSTNLENMLHGGASFEGFRLSTISQATASELQMEQAHAETNPSARKFNLDKVALMVDAIDLARRAVLSLSPENLQVYRRGKFYNQNTRGIPCSHDNKPWTYGQIIRDEMLSLKFNGMTGPVEFTPRGMRHDSTVEYIATGLNIPLFKHGDYKNNTATIMTQSPLGLKRTITRANLSVIRITSIMTKPFLQYKIDSTTKKREINKLTGEPILEGFSVDLAKLIEVILRKKSFIYNREFKIVLVKDNQYGAPKNKTYWTGMIGELMRGEAEIAIAPLTITSERERVVDFTKPYLQTGISIMIKKPERQKPGVFSFLDPFSGDIWYCTVCGYCGSTIILYLVGRISPFEWRNETGKDGKTKVKTQFTMRNSMWFVLAAIMQQGTDLTPRASSARIAGSSWWFFTLILISSYTANLAAFLTVESLVTPFNSVEEMADQSEIKYGTVNGGSTKRFFQKMWRFMQSQPENEIFVNTAEEGVLKVRNSKGGYAFLLEASMNEYWNQRKPCTTMRIGDNLDSKGYGVALSLNSQYKDDVEDAVLQLKEKGELPKLLTKWWYDKGECLAMADDSSSKKPSPLTLRNLTGIFYILIGGLGLALIVAVIEYIYRTQTWKYNRAGQTTLIWRHAITAKTTSLNQ